MAKILFLVGLFLTLFLACSKKNGEEAIPQADACHLKTIVLNDKPYRTYEYNGERQLYRIVQYGSASPEKRFTFDYNSDNQLITFRETNLVAPVQNFQYTITYTGKDKIESIKQFKITNTATTLLETFLLEYDSQNRISKYSWKNNYWRYEYSETNNVIKWIVRIPELFLDEVVVAEYGNYDGKKNIYSNSFPTMMVNLIMGKVQSAENPGSIKYFDGGTSPTQTGVVTYQYNEMGLPTNSFFSFFSPNNAPTAEVYKFTYECL